MIKSKGIFAVSFIAMMVAGGAYANIASQGYVDQQIDTRQVAGDYATNTALGTVRTTATNAQSAAAAAKTAADAAASAAATAQKTADAKVAAAQGSGNANKAVITNSSGSVTTGTISSAMITDGTITNADISASAAIAQSKISGLTTALAGKANTADVPTKTSDLTNDSGFITEDDLPDGYTLPVATANTLGGVKSGGDITVATSGAVTVNSATKADSATTAASATKATQDASGNVITSTYATKTEVGSKLSSISGSTSGTGNVVTSVSASGSTVSATKGITAEETKNKVTSVRAASSATDTAYPSEKAVATALAAKANTSALSGYATTSALGAVEDKAEAAQTAANGKVTANAAITAGTATKITYDAKGLVTGGASLTASDIPTIPSTKVSGLGTLATKSAVTSAEITDGTITNADIAANAAIAASKVSGLSTVATSGSYNDLADKPSIPSAYVLKAATADTLGGVKSGGDITVSSTGAVTVNSATRADSATTATTATNATNATNATKATQDASGNVITSTYATKSQITALDSTSTGTGAVVTGVSQTDGKVTVTKGNVQIPVGSATATTYATIWVE